MTLILAHIPILGFVYGVFLCSFSFGKGAIAFSLCNYCDDFFTYSSLGLFFKE
jgi:hypothetical protein